MTTLEQQTEYITTNFTKDITINRPIKNNNLIIYIDKTHIVEFLTFLRDDKTLSFKILIDLFGADMLGVRSPRFEIIYNLLSLKALFHFCGRGKTPEF